MKMKTKRHFLQISIITMILMIMISMTLFIFYKPQEDIIVDFNHYNPVEVDYLSIKDHLGYETKAYFFCSKENIDCIYTDTEIIPNLLTIANTERFEQIYFVDITSIDENILPSALKNHLGFSNYPAFVLLSYTDNNFIIHAVYEWKDDAVFTIQNLKQWMQENNLWKNEYTN